MSETFRKFWSEIFRFNIVRCDVCKCICQQGDYGRICSWQCLEIKWNHEMIESLQERVGVLEHQILDLQTKKLNKIKRRKK